MKIEKVLWILAMTAIVAVGFISMVGTRRSGGCSRTLRRIGTEVKIDNFSFGPMTMTVTLGTAFTWTNNDDVPHTRW